MRYLENAFKFLGKFYLLVIPLFFAVAIPAIIAGSGSTQMLAQIQELQKSMLTNPEMFQDPSALVGVLSTLQPFFVASGVAGFISFILTLIIRPATYGMVNKALETGSADLNDFIPEMKNNFLKYILFGLGTIAVYFGIVVAALIIFVILGVLSSALKAVGVLLIVLFAIAFFVFIFAFSVLTYLWFPAMVADNLGVFEALKKSVSVVKTYFWPIVGISLLMGIGAAIAGGILGLARSIPIIGPAIASISTVLVEFIMMVFAFEVYRDKTGKSDYMNEGSMPETPGDYL